jgi:hypothetical protein
MTSNAYEPLLGGIYQTRWDARPLRVIGCNETEIHYDCWWPELKSWSFSGTRKSRVSFYRTSVQAFMEGAQLLEERPFSQSEWNCFRPDLPLHAFRNPRLFWKDIPNDSIASFQSWCDAQPDLSSTATPLIASDLVFCALLKNGNPSKGMHINAPQNALRLLWHAAQIHQQWGGASLSGIGLYRLGYERGIPSYYIGGSQDLAGLYSALPQ